MSARSIALEQTNKKNFTNNHSNGKIPSGNFARHVFTLDIMEKMLPKEASTNAYNAMQGKEKIKAEHADAIAVAMREWAISFGATHYCHWFQPLTGMTAEKHDSFIDWKTPDIGIEKFSGKELIQGEPDASSFPSGGLRTTYEARGYTGWDPSSPVFIWEAGDGRTLYIPSVFFSWTGDILDNKIPLIRSDNEINEAALRLLKLTGIKADKVYSTLGLEQEYFVIDKSLRDLRPDLVILGRAVFGAAPPKGQEMQDHYFGSVKDRILSYMKDFEEAALKLGIPVKTRHNEVAPAQHEVAPVFERASLSVDHNIMLMELMRQIAVKHNLSCLLHEKPFDGLNGSGKHHNWSLSTDNGRNLLNPTDSPENSMQFLILLTAILSAIHEHAELVRSSIGSAGNDYRLGGHEAPPAIISVYLGETLETILDNITEEIQEKSPNGRTFYDFGISVLPDLKKDPIDRNRTSPFAFTGNKFEFRAVGSSSSGAFPATVLNAIIAKSLHKILDEIEANLGDDTPSPSSESLANSAMPIIRKYLKSSKDIRFSGDNYGEEWKEEAKRRGLPNIEKSFDAFFALKKETTFDAFKEILSQEELFSRYEVITEQYANTVNIEANLMIEIFNTQILPATVKFQGKFAESIKLSEKLLGIPLEKQKERLKEISEGLERSIDCINDLEKSKDKGNKLEGNERGKAFCQEVSTKCKKCKAIVDRLENLVDDKEWPLPKYRELLFQV